MFIRATWKSKSEPRQARNAAVAGRFVGMSARPTRTDDSLGCADARFIEMTRGLFD